jgi:putative phage-type endonuclease
MKFIDVEQGSEEWLKWRKTVITATDCPAIMGSSPWVTEYKCWQRKLALVDEQKSNAAMERGKKLEPEARAHFIENYGINMTPVVVESSEFEFLGASLDGISDCHKYVLEIKCGGEKLHKMALDGIVPQYYIDQIQHQLLVTGAQKAFYFSYDGFCGKCIEIFPDPTFKERFMPKARTFWKNVAFFEPPSLQDSDYKNMEDRLDWEEYANLYQETDKSLKALEQKKDYLRKKLIELCEDQNCSGNGVKVMKIMTKGKVVYDIIPEMQGIDVEKYRKLPSATWKVMLEGKS